MFGAVFGGFGGLFLYYFGRLLGGKTGNYWKATGTTLVPVARLLAAQPRARKQPGGWSTGRISPPWILGINRAMFEPETSPAVVCWLCVMSVISYMSARLA